MEGMEDIKAFARRHRVLTMLSACGVAVAAVMYAASKADRSKRYPYGSTMNTSMIPPAGTNWYVLVPKE